MRLLSVASIAMILSAAAFGHGVTKPGSARIVTLKPANFEKTLKTLRGQGRDVAGIDLDKQTIDVILRGNEQLSEVHTSETAIEKEHDLLAAPDDQYHNPDEVKASLEQLAGEFPEISKLEVIGQSLEGRNIYALKISDNPEVRESDEPAILFNSMHHAREVMTTEVGVDIAETLLRGYGVDARITAHIEDSEIWVLPMLNVDGNNLVWTRSNMWRKNARGGYGVDINRNYPYKWGACNGSSGWQSSQTYRGPSAASEPETNVLMNLVRRIQPVFNISYHSYSELVLYPYGCEGERVEQRNIVEGIGRTLASKLVKDSGRGTYRPGTPWEILYGVDGGDVDWMYNEQGVIPYVIELNASSQGFQPSYSRWRQPTVEKQREGWLYLLDRLQQSGIRGQVKTNEQITNAVINVANLNNRSEPIKTHKVKNDGSYHIVLDPGMYELRIFLNGEQVIKQFTVGTTLIKENFQL